MSTDFFHLILVIAFFGLIFLISEFWRHAMNPPVEWTRKFIHFFCGIVISCFPWIFQNNWPVVLLCSGIGAAMLIARIYSWPKSIYDIERKSFGDFYYLFSVVILFMISHDQPLYYFIAMLILTISDTLAAVLGSTYSRLSYIVEEHYKSLEGSVIFFLSTFLIVHFPLLLFTNLQRLECVLIAIQVALIVTFFEAICLNGIDNLIVPVAAYYLLGKFSSISNEEMIMLISIQIILIGIINLIVLKMNILTMSGAITLLLFFFGAFILGGPIWILPPLIPVALVLALLTYLYSHSAQHGKKIYQVIAIFYLSLIPASIYILHNIFINYFTSPHLINKNVFYPLYVGAISAQFAITILRLNWLFKPSYKMNILIAGLISIICFLIVAPFSILIQFHEIEWKNIIVSAITGLSSPLFLYLFFQKWWKNETNFPSQFRIQAISIALGTLLAIPFYLYTIRT